MSEAKFSCRAYCKMILHAAKYPHAAVNGVLLASDKKKGGVVNVVDVVPLFHISLNLAPMAEIALTQIDHFASSQGLVVAGYYQANESLRDLGFSKPVHKIAEKIAENYNQALEVTLDNKHITLAMDQVAFFVSQCVDGRWRTKERGTVENENSTLQGASLLLQLQSYDQLVDFDNHLDNPTRDWANLELNEAINNALGEDEDDEDYNED